jgi:hypothetical protein
LITTPFNIGDAIYDVNGKTIPQIVNSLGKYIPALTPGKK